MINQIIALILSLQLILTTAVRLTNKVLAIATTIANHLEVLTETIADKNSNSHDETQVSLMKALKILLMHSLKY